MLDAETLWDLVVRRADRTPDGELAVDDLGRRMTFRQLREQAERVAAGLAAEHGVGAGTVVSWQLPTWLESLVLVCALSRLGALQNPILPIYREREVGFMTRQIGSELLAVPPPWRGFDYAEMAERIAKESGERLRVLVVDRHADEPLPSADPAVLPMPPGSPDDARWVFYTSGTSADPKGAKHADATLRPMARGMAQRLDMTEHDRTALVFPFTHIGGIGWLFASLMAGTTLIAPEAFDPATAIPLLAAEGVTLAGAGTPFHLAYLTAQRAQPHRPLFPKVRAFPGGASPKPPQLHYDIARECGGVGIVSGYGLTECPILTMASVDDPTDKLAHTEGRALPGVELVAVAPDGLEVPPEEEGELRARAPQCMKGYVDTILDADVFDPQGRLRTGDLGRIDAEGYVVITGRLKDIIIRKGENVSAKEVEDLLYRHPKVADVAVIGLPDDETGERVCAVVATRDAADPLTFAEAAQFLSDEGLITRKLPEQLELVDAIPRNPAGKPEKRVLKERFAGTRVTRPVRGA